MRQQGNRTNLILRRARSARLEGWATHKVLVRTKGAEMLRADRDAVLRTAPQGEVLPQ